MGDATIGSLPGMPSPALAPPIPATVLRTVPAGLEPRPGLRKRVVIIGAGMAGLVAGFELARQGHEPVILEAQNRVGGRIYTLRSFAPGLYAEAGAMRIPRVHRLTLEYCHLFGLQLRPFVMDNPRAPVYLAGRRMTLEQLDRDPSLIPFELAAHERGRTYAELWAEATREVRELYEQKGEAAHTILGRLYDQYSIRDFLKQQGFSEGAVELFGVLSYREANLGASVVEQLREILGRAFEDMQEIAGGMDLLPNAFYQRLRRQVRLGAQVVAVDQNADHVTVHYKTASGTYAESGDYCICTVPFGVLRHLDFVPHLSKGKYRAIRSLNYNPSTKILLQVRHRFWEQHHGTGGATPTDLPIRRIVYPSHAPADEERGVLLASYTWGQDAARWGALGPAERIALALKDVAKIHPEVLREVEGGASHAWYNDPYAVGAFALFEPGQETALHGDIVRPEGRIHFAGEHTSLWHAWIQGALESGTRAAAAIHEAPEPSAAHGSR
ncbi:flavin monoamine oxidase family protein [Kribbella catacumbae]|uniref:flavin monoamine oxidase family protein n=1 Tax=Kribbella catacumbae TaxID=460086 RepID=UPI0003657525|nr:flavin monoamine oxidase family protein [Kribbella catacumbae]